MRGDGSRAWVEDWSRRSGRTEGKVRSEETQSNLEGSRDLTVKRLQGGFRLMLQEVQPAAGHLYCGVVAGP